MTDERPPDDRMPGQGAGDDDATRPFEPVRDDPASDAGAVTPAGARKNTPADDLRQEGPEVQWHTLTTEETLGSLSTDLEQGLAQTARQISAWQQMLGTTDPALRNRLEASSQIVSAALRRTQSCGAHARTDDISVEIIKPETEMM